MRHRVVRLLACLVVAACTSTPATPSLTSQSPSSTSQPPSPLLSSSGAPATSTPGSSPPVGLFVQGQTLSGDGWRLIAGGVGLRNEPASIGSPAQIELFTDRGIVKPESFLDLPASAPAIDPVREAALVIDLLVGGGPGCGQIRVDGVVFDLASRTVTARITDGSPAACAPPATSASILVAVALDHMPTGPVMLRFGRATGATDWITQAEQSTTIPPPPIPASEVTVADAAGTFRHGGLWATRGAAIYLSTDHGASWQVRTMPAAAIPAVLDARHMWVVHDGPGSTADPCFCGSDVVHFIIDRTTDGGRTWHTSRVPGNYPGTKPVLAFQDALRGYLVASADRISTGVTTILRTTDGGATWRVTGHEIWLGSIVGVGPGGTLWAGSEPEAGPVARPVLDMSRDGGRTWKPARLPGLRHAIGPMYTALGPPVFTSSRAGVVAIEDGSGEVLIVRFYLTADGGRTWSLVVGPQIGDGGASTAAIASATHWLLPGATPGTLAVTSDGGGTWQATSALGLHDLSPDWLGFEDPFHGLALVWLGGNSQSTGLFVTADGGAAWEPAGFGH